MSDKNVVSFDAFKKAKQTESKAINANASHAKERLALLKADGRLSKQFYDAIEKVMTSIYIDTNDVLNTLPSFSLSVELAVSTLVDDACPQGYDGETSFLKFFYFRPVLAERISEAEMFARLKLRGEILNAWRSSNNATSIHVGCLAGAIMYTVFNADTYRGLPLTYYSVGIDGDQLHESFCFGEDLVLQVATDLYSLTKEYMDGLNVKVSPAAFLKL